ncbi:IS3 family transposase [Raoultibacter phocaeensis]|uniref:IS3 family transposase n=1 Tax=Raoultibacter phocaeensis TaxID=2479841 RepID=UPI0011183397|nr:IS3 family transposase [Raoultibacter phocaeensis]
MYTEREKVRYVETMWAEGLTPRAAERKWGTPSRESLRRWLEQAEEGSLPAEMPRVKGRAEHAPHSRYPEATKAEAVRLYGLGEKPAHIARRLGIAEASIISVWSRKARKSAIMSETGAEGAPREDEGAKPGMGQAAGSDDRRIEALRAELEEALFEVSVYKELMRDPKAASPASLSKRRLVGLGERLRRDCGCSLARISTFLGISKSTYLYHRARLDSPSGMTDGGFDGAVAAAFAENGGIYGYRRLKAALEAGGVRAPERRVRESMARQGLVARCSRSEKRWSSYAGEVSDAPGNLLLGEHGRHDFSADAPNELWLTDITEMRGRDGKCYLSAVVDCFDGKVVAWRASESPNAELANSTLADAIATLREGQRPVIHSDRGGHYRWKGWIALCEGAGLVRSMSRKGHSPDNAACEGFFGRAKVEAFHSLVRAGAPVAEIFEAVARYITWYNDGRLKTFRENGKKATCETIEGRRRRLGLAA